MKELIDEYIYFFRWEKPDERVTAALEARLDASQKQVEENLQVRKYTDLIMFIV